MAPPGVSGAVRASFVAAGLASAALSATAASPSRARPASLKQIATGTEDSRWMEGRGTVRSAAIVDDIIEVVLGMDGGRMKLHVKDWGARPEIA